MTGVKYQLGPPKLALIINHIRSNKIPNPITVAKKIIFISPFHVKLNRKNIAVNTISTINKYSKKSHFCRRQSLMVVHDGKRASRLLPRSVPARSVDADIDRSPPSLTGPLFSAEYAPCIQQHLYELPSTCQKSMLNTEGAYITQSAVNILDEVAFQSRQDPADRWISFPTGTVLPK